jgi:hypothetical protein
MTRSSARTSSSPKGRQERRVLPREERASEEFGHVCKAEKNVVATGTVSEKDGNTWIDRTKLDQPTS